jgi:hypothetical protein
LSNQRIENVYLPSYHYLGVRAFIFLFISCIPFLAVAQQEEPVVKDSVNRSAPARTATVSSDSLGPRLHSPRTATLLSLALPGAGQVYNKKNWWWKVPIIYGAGGALVYGVVFYQGKYKDFREQYAFRIENNTEQSGNAYYDKFPNESLLTIRNNYREARDQCVIGIVLLYALQAVDACVEAHFFDFNVSDDLSLNVQPQFVMYGPMQYKGVQLTLRLH